MKSYNIFLCNAPLQNGNRGCVALTISSIYFIDKVMSSLDIAYNIYLPDAQIKTWRFQNKLNLLGKEISVIPCSYNTPISTTKEIKNKIKKVLKLILHKSTEKEYFKDADFVLNIGQGDSFSDIYGETRFEEMNLAYVIAQKYNIPYCVLPQTIGPFKSTKVESDARKSIEGAAMVMVRDKQSYDYTKKISPIIDCKEYIDIAFFLPYDKIMQNSSFLHVGINVSALLWNGGYTRNNQFELKDDYKKVVRSVIDYFLSLPNVKLHLVPHVVEQERGIENDYEVSYELWREYNNPNLILAPFALGPIEIKSYISGLDFFMGARMHATIGAFSSGVPVVPMAYSRKFNGLFEDTLDYHYMTDLKTQTSDDVMAIVKSAFEKRAVLKNIINDRMQTIVKEREVLMYRELCKFFNLR